MLFTGVNEFYSLEVFVAENSMDGKSVVEGRGEDNPSQPPLKLRGGVISPPLM